MTCSATPNSSNTHNWLYNAATSGTFYKASTESWSSDASGIPSGWTVVDAVIDLSTVTSDTILPNGWTVTGTLAGNYKISIAHGAIVTLHNVDINGSGSLNGSFAGITCEGDATIILSGTNTVRGFDTYYSGIQAGRYSSEPNPATLIIQGTGSLTAIGGNYGAGIGSSCSSFNRCGNIVINGGTITATGGQRVRASEAALIIPTAATSLLRTPLPALLPRRATMPLTASVTEDHLEAVSAQ